MDIKKEIDVVLSSYPLLNYNGDKNEFIGELFITNSDSYEIRIDLTPYPRFFPNVYELDGRIPNKPHRHIYTDTGSCCFTTRAKAQILLNSKIKNLSLFIKNIVIPYFQNNSYFEINKEYKTDEHSHDSKGVVEGYRDILQLTNDVLIAQFIYRRINGEKLTIRDNCYCGSGTALKKCSEGNHDKAYRDFKKIEKEVLSIDLEHRFFPYLKSIGAIK